MLGLAAITGILYIRTAGFQFVDIDDPMNITGNARVLSRSLSGLWAIWTTPYLRLYIPLSYTAWFAIAKLSANPSAALFHLANVLLHVANVLLVFRLIRRLLGELRGGSGSSRDVAAAWARRSLHFTRFKLSRLPGQPDSRMYSPLSSRSPVCWR
jgi:hypothetical protein